MSDQAPVVLSGRYELRRRIARGGMAEVYLARDQLLERPVAVKILVPEFATDQSFVERFRREAQAAANLNHPNVVGVYDWGKEAGTHFIVMEFVDGRSLADILKAEGAVHPDRAADIVSEVANALGFAHRNGVVHRDVKPGNVLISNDGQVKVADFGIARAITSGAEANLTQTGSVMGTATYFSPEQAQGKAVDPRSDLYSLGVVMYEMVCRRPPFQGDSPVAIAYKHVQEPVTPLRQINPAIPIPYEAIAMKLLAKNPANRYATAEDLRDDLRRFREGRPVLAEGLAGAAAVAGAPTIAAAPATRAMNATQTGAAAAAGTQFEEPPRRRTGLFVLAALVLLALLGAGLYFLAKSLGVDKSGSLKVPNVVGQPATQARSTLTNAGFSVKSPNKLEYSDTIPADQVIATDPKAGSSVDKGASIQLIVSAGKQITMPNLAGMQVDDAVALLEQKGVSPDNIVQQQQKSDQYDTGDVISSDPGSGQVLPAGGKVTLTVSSGPSSTVPDGLVGVDLSTATQALTGAGYQISVKRQSSDTAPENQVISVNPPSGTPLKKGSTVTVVVSSGPAPTTTTTTSTTTPPSSSSSSTSTTAPAH